MDGFTSAIGGGSGKTSLDTTTQTTATTGDIKSATDVASGNLYYKSTTPEGGYFKYAVLAAVTIAAIVYFKKGRK